MKTPLLKPLLFVLVASACVAPANAIPIVFDIAGSVANRFSIDLASGHAASDNAMAGQSFNAQFTIDTEAFGAPAALHASTFDGFSFVGSGLTSSLWVAGEEYTTAPWSSNAGVASLIDSRGVFGCGAGCVGITPDQYSLLTRSEDLGVNGPTRVRTLAFLAYEAFDPTSAGSGTSWIDFTRSASLDQLLSLPAGGAYNPPILSLTDAFFACDGGCLQTGYNETRFTIASVSVTSTQVPEPSTLALFAAGLLGAAWAARRQPAVLKA